MWILLKHFVFTVSFCSLASTVYADRPAKDIEDDLLRKGPDVVDLIDLTNGMVVADVFGGGGYYSEIISYKVGKQGTVYLHNNTAYIPYVDKKLMQRLAKNRLPNVIRHDKDVDNLSFGTDSLDAIFYVLGFHDLYYTADGWHINVDSLLSQLSDALKVGGKLIIVDHQAPKGTGSSTSQTLHRIEKGFVIKVLENYGFKYKRSSSLLENDTDNLTLSALEPSMRRKTSRFILIFEKVN